jgi:hypothetical protein
MSCDQHITSKEMIYFGLRHDPCQRNSACRASVGIIPGFALQTKTLRRQAHSSLFFLHIVSL